PDCRPARARRGDRRRGDRAAVGDVRLYRPAPRHDLGPRLVHDGVLALRAGSPERAGRDRVGQGQAGSLRKRRPMAALHTLEPRHRPSACAAFTRTELPQMLSVYSRRVADGEWRDYAIDSRDGRAIFSIFRRSFESPLFAIVKQPAEESPEYALFAG